MKKRSKLITVWRGYVVRTATGEPLAIHASSFSASKHIDALRNKCPGLVSGKAEWVDVKFTACKVGKGRKR